MGLSARGFTIRWVQSSSNGGGEFITASVKRLGHIKIFIHTVAAGGSTSTSPSYTTGQIYWIKHQGRLLLPRWLPASRTTPTSPGSCVHVDFLVQVILKYNYGVTSTTQISRLPARLYFNTDTEQASEEVASTSASWAANTTSIRTTIGSMLKEREDQLDDVQQIKQRRKKSLEEQRTCCIA